MNARRRLNRAAPAACAACMIAALAACTVGPDYVRPTAAVAPNYKELDARLQGSGWKLAQPADTAPRGAWWQVYHDPQLDALENRVASANQNVQAAEARFRSARAAVAEFRSQYFPTLTAGADTQRARTSANVLYKSTAGFTVPDNSVGLDASWEPDLWGRVARSVEGARAGAQASAADWQGALLSMQAELALDYFALRYNDRQQKLLNDTLAAYRQALDLTQQRYSGGIATEADVGQAQAQLQTTQAQAIDLGVQRAQLEHAVAILVGQSPSTFSLPPAAWRGEPVVMPTGLPSALLERRPDIAAAERRVAQANAQVGVATAAFFPSLMLAVTGGLEATNFSPWLTAPSRFWTLGPAIAGTLFDGGQRAARKAQAQADYDESVADYRQTVLTAFQQVEDNLAALRVLEREAVAQDNAVKAAERALALTTNRYQNGAVTYLDVVVSQTTALTDERSALDIAARRMAASVALIKALGGGWSTAALPSNEQLAHPDQAAAVAGSAATERPPGVPGQAVAGKSSRGG